MEPAGTTPSGACGGAAGADAGGPTPTARCLNCGAGLFGPWCAACGQKHDPRPRSLVHFLADALEGLTHADSRLWRTLGALVFRPGRLTADHFAGRRARYLPAVRLYLVISLVFFVLVALAPRGVTFKAAAQGASIVVEAAVGPASEAPGGAGRGAGAASGADRAPADVCRSLEYSGPFRTSLRPRIEAACEDVVRNRGRSLRDQFVGNLPRALFVLLPAMAAFMLLLYRRPRRWYVEHLMFLVHAHSFLFAVGSVFLLLSLAAPAVAGSGLVVTALWLWFAAYLYLALRVAYAEDAVRTTGKLVALLAGYAVALQLLLVGTLLFSALTF